MLGTNRWLSLAKRSSRTHTQHPKGNLCLHAILPNSREFQLAFVDIAPAPSLTGFDGAHDGMFRLVKMLGGVLVL